MIQYVGLFWLGLLTLMCWAVLSVWAADAGLKRKALWTGVVLALPGFGLIAWYLMGPRRAA